MRVTIQTPSGPRQIPDWAACHCVSRHTPSYAHPMPFVLPDSTEMWLCPNTHHQATTLLKVYRDLNGPPDFKTQLNFTVFVRGLIKLFWQQKTLIDREAAEVAAAKQRIREERAAEDRMHEAFRAAREAANHG